jgi:hypothetical protein
MGEPQDKPLSSRSAFACNIYSMVPFIGVVFLPIALVFGSVGYIRARRAGNKSDLRFGVGSLVLTLAVAGVQVFLWWLLYIVPRWAV